MTLKSHRISKEFVVLTPELDCTTVENNAEVYEKLDRDFNRFKGHCLISSYTFSTNWPSWEVHPHGDETVLLMSGHVTFILDLPDGRKSITLDKPGSYVIVPKGIWHTAHTETETVMLFITPGEGTEHRDM